MRPDIAWATAKLGEFLANLSAVHKNAIKHLDRYIQGTLYYELVLGKHSDICFNDGELTLYADVSFADNSNRRALPPSSNTTDTGV